MGMDFRLYWLRKNEDNLDTMSWKELEAHTLCYARKGWELVYHLGASVDELYTPLKKETWDSLITAMAPVGPQLKEIWDAFHMYYNTDDDFDEFAKWEPEKAKLMKKYQYWYDSTFERNPSLGYAFSVSYMIDFWEARDKVKTYLGDPNYEVIMEVSQ